jgi:hypothetical protein
MGKIPQVVMDTNSTTPQTKKARQTTNDARDTIKQKLPPQPPTPTPTATSATNTHQHYRRHHHRQHHHHHQHQQGYR